ncbi:hypothetical protein ACPPVO_35435 [Dactylosporangium sp. McL0621]|uniref:hypothetical protein n=1 Tax=Dactylosporangium sp. McL0621 TaxID=3415678 RepID=UPI003CF801FC
MMWNGCQPKAEEGQAGQHAGEHGRGGGDRHGGELAGEQAAPGDRGDVQVAQDAQSRSADATAAASIATTMGSSSGPVNCRLAMAWLSAE